MKKVVSEISGTVFSLPWLIAKDHGLFEAEGIEMEFVRSRPSGTDEIVEDTYHWMVRWGLISSAACAANLVDNRLHETASATAGD